MTQALIADTPYYPSGGINPDSNGIIIRPEEAVDCLNLDITGSEVLPRFGTMHLNPATTPVPSQPLEDVIHYQEYMIPAGDTLLFGFTDRNIYSYHRNTGWTSVLSSTLVGGLRFDQWSTCPFVDLEYGATIVAAASTYTQPDEFESSSARLLLFYNSTSEQFEKLDININFPITMEATGETAPSTDTVTGGPLDNSSDSHIDFVKLTPGLFAILTENGVLCTAGSLVHNTGGKDFYRLLPVDGEEIEYGDDSYVTLDGTEWQVKFLKGTYLGYELYASYYYERIMDYRPKVVQMFHGSLVFANTFEDSVYYPWRLRYTVPGDMTITTDSWYVDLVLSNSSGIREMKQGSTETFDTVGTYLYVYKDKGVLRGTYDPTNFITFDTAFTEGIYANRTIQNVDGYQFFLGTNDVYAFDGVNRVSLTYDAEMKGTRVREYLMSILDPIVLKNTFAVYDSFRRKYMLFIKKVAETFPTEVLVYDVDRKFWVRYEMPATSAAIHLALTLSFNTIDSLPGVIDDLPGTIDELGGVSTNQVTIFAMTKVGYVAVNKTVHDKVSYIEDTQQPIIHSLTTKDFLFKTLEEAERISMMKWECKGTSVEVRYSTEYDTLIDNFVKLDEHYVFNLTGNYKTYFYNCDVQADKIRFMFRSTSNFSLRWLQVFSVPTTEITEE